MQKGICQECKDEYDYEYNPKFPRKYCPECSAKKKAEYELTNSEQTIAPIPLNVPVVKIGAVAKEEVKKEVSEELLIRKDKQNSYEFGKAGSRFKVYFNTPEELKVLVKGLIQDQKEFEVLE